jgi:hypothetical protein
MRGVLLSLLLWEFYFHGPSNTVVAELGRCECPEAVYKLTLRREFCGLEMIFLGGSTDCFHENYIYECPGKETEKPKERHIRTMYGSKQKHWCKIHCEGGKYAGNPNACRVAVTTILEESAGSFEALYRYGLLPKPHLKQ